MKKEKLGLNKLATKEMINHPIKAFYKRTCNKKVQLFTVFLFSLTAV